MSSNFITDYRFTFSPNRVVQTKVWAKSYTRTLFGNERSLNNLKNNSHNGKLSDQAKKKINKAIDWLLAAATKKRVWHKSKKKSFTFEINFVTLTIPRGSGDAVSPSVAKKMLNNFLTLMRKYYGLNQYVWKLEFNKNGNPHIHLTTDTFLHLAIIRRAWNTQLRNSGLLHEFRTTHGHDNPNSTDVHSVYKIKNVAAYLSKYMSKDDEQLSADVGRIWGCSEGLSKAIASKMYIPVSDCGSFAAQLYCEENRPYYVYSEPNTYGDVYDRCVIFSTTIEWWRRKASDYMREVFADVIGMLRGYKLQMSTTYVV